MKLLVDRGADVTLQTKSDSDPLKKAVECQEKEMAMIFLKNGADVDSQNAKGITPLMAAWKADMINFLLENGATLDLQGNEGRSALFNRVIEKNYVASDLLLRRGANPDLPSGVSAAHILRKECNRLVSVTSY